MSEAYGAFAYAYDRALGRRFFKAARLLLDQLLESYPAKERTHLDVACGTGSAVQYFRRKGWRSVGVDASLEMLQLAGGGVAADMRALPFRGTFARVTCLYDSLNHLLQLDDLTAAFKAIRGVMNEESLFFFDMNHPEIYPEVWGLADPYVSSGRDYHLELDTTYRKRDRLGRAVVTGWAKIDGRRVEIREEHLQRAYGERDITNALAEAGLEPVEIFHFDPYGEAEELEAVTVKLFFVARTVG
ncbi:MAG TPA: class I SAM-dependent methyltransferase [Thermoanaerobaculia bacterium]|nr:class I SAM-dependent methyltransferase [Thermoanaerobaculia bacterium]